MTQIFLLPITPEYTAKDATLINYLPPKRVEQLMNFIHESDKKNCLFSYLLVKYCISLYRDIDIHSLQFGYSKTNKPILLSHPNIHFNLSHTKGFICCTISDTPCGIDVEYCNEQIPDILDIAFTEVEKNFLKKCYSDKNLYMINFYKMWTLKEAYTKALGTGLFEDISTINTLDEHFTNNSFTISKDNYIISSYSNCSNPENTTILSESSLYKYFLRK